VNISPGNSGSLVAAIKTAVLADLNYLQLRRAPDAKKYDSTPLDDLQEYKLSIVYLLSQLKLNNIISDLLPKLTKSDSSAEAPLTRTTHMAFEQAILNAGIIVPVDILPIIDFLTQPIQVGLPNFLNSRWSSYFIPTQFTASLTNLEAELSHIIAKMRGLLAGNLLNLNTRPLNPSDLYCKPPVTLDSDYGQLMTAYYPIKNVSTETGDSFDNTTKLQVSLKWGIPTYFALLPLFRVGGTTEFGQIMTASANKLSIKYAAQDASSLTELDNTSELFDCFNNVAGGRSAAQRDPHMYWRSDLATGFAGEGDWDKRMVLFLARWDGKPLPIIGVPATGDLPVRSEHPFGYQTSGFNVRSRRSPRGGKRRTKRDEE
jgi:hypothetical protein